MPETCHSAFAKSRCTAIVERIIKMISTVDYCAHMHCDVDLRSRRMWAASYQLTRLIMNEDSHVSRGPDTGRERVLTQRRGDGDDGAMAPILPIGNQKPWLQVFTWIYSGLDLLGLDLFLG